MKKTIIIAVTLFAAMFAARAQNTTVTAVDSTYAGQAAVDSTLVGKSIFQMLGDGKVFSREGKVVIDQTQAVEKAMAAHIRNNAAKRQTGFRVRIFFDNKQNARTMSERVAASFKAAHPGISVYRDYENPYFKVTVGDFRTKEDARRFMNSIKGAYPSSFIVREKINFPVM
ncbi:MAG: SPOR domain-containing protein [Bacteroidales bacterium]|nr:SPOR domain-containing protein [Bacteroidales bacterium]